MGRNLDHRIEVVVPVEDAAVRNELEFVFKTLLADNSQAGELMSDGSWERVQAKKNERRKPAQVAFMRRRERARRLGFFFSSRRRHTRWTGDWSSDVCSSD